MIKIIHNLFCGDKYDVLKALEQNFAVASMCKESNYGHRDLVGYSTLGCPQDSPNYYFIEKGKEFAANLIDVEDPTFIKSEVITPALKFIKKHYDKGEKVLIRCEGGESRGPTTTLMFLRSINEFPYSYKNAYKIMKTIYPKLDPGKGMEIYAKTHWNDLLKVYEE
jgi:hypothetical protein